MNSRVLSRLRAHAQEWAGAYVELTEALLARGVPEARAREEARGAATTAALWPEEEHVPGCPFCAGGSDGL